MPASRVSVFVEHQQRPSVGFMVFHRKPKTVPKNDKTSLSPRARHFLKRGSDGLRISVRRSAIENFGRSPEVLLEQLGNNGMVGLGISENQNIRAEPLENLEAACPRSGCEQVRLLRIEKRA